MSTYDEVVKIEWLADQPLKIADDILAKLNQIDTLLGTTIPASIGKMGTALAPIATTMAGLAADARAYADAMSRAGTAPQPTRSSLFGSETAAPAGGVRTATPASSVSDRLQAFAGRSGPYPVEGDPQTEAYFRQWMGPGTRILPEGAAGGIQQTTAATRAYSEEVEKADFKLTGFSRTIVRHLSTLAVMIVAYKAFYTVADQIHQVANEFIQLESISARVGFVTGQAVGGARAGVIGQVLAGAQYGIQPQESQQGALLAAQTNATIQQQEQAQQVAFVFGAKEYNNALSEIIQTQKRADAAGIAHIDILGYIAKAYQSVPGTVETYFDALQAGETIYKDIGVTAEQAGLVVAKAAYAMESGADAAANTVQAIINKLRKPETQTALEGFSVTGTGIPELLRNSAAALQNLINTGQDQRAQQLIALLSGGTISVQRIREAPLLFLELSNAIKDSGGSLGDFNKLMNDVGDTTDKRIARMSASWQVMLMSLGNTGPIKGFFDFLNRGMDDYTARLNAASAATAGQDLFSKMSPADQQKYIDLFNQGQKGKFKITGVTDGQPVIIPQAQGLQGIMDIGFVPEAKEAFYAAIFQNQQKLNDPAGLTGARGVTQTAQSLAQAMIARSQPPPAEFGGFGNLPSGIKGDADWQRFVASVQGFEKTLAQEVPGYKQNPKEVAFWDESIHNFRKLVGDSQAIALATKAIQDNTSKVQGAFNVPAGGQAMIDFYAADYMAPRTGGAAGIGGGVSGTRGGGGPMSALDYFRMGNYGYPVGRFHEPNPMDWAGADPGPSRGLGGALGRMGALAAGAATHMQQMSGITINNRITVVVDGKVVSQTLNRQFHQQNYGNNSVGGNPSSLLVQ